MLRYTTRAELRLEADTREPKLRAGCYCRCVNNAAICVPMLARGLKGTSQPSPAPRRRARYVTKANLAFSPFSGGSTTSFLGELRTRKVRELVPDMAVVVKRLRDKRGGETPKSLLSLTFVDGKELVLDMCTHTKKELFAQLELQNGRLELEAMQRGKPWI